MGSKKIEIDVHNHVENPLEIEGSFSKVQTYMIDFIFFYLQVYEIFIIL